MTYKKHLGMRIVGIILFGALFAGCRSHDLNRYYTPIAGVTGVAFEGDPTIEARVGDPMEDVYKMMESDYIAIGIASFDGVECARYKGPILKLAKEHKAEKALTYCRYNRTEMEVGAVPISTLNTTTVQTPSPFGGFQTTTVMTPTTSFVPYSSSNNVYNNDVVLYQRDANPPKFGALFCELSEDEARSFGTRDYMKIKRVIRGKAAWNSNLFGGDIVLEVNGKKPTPEEVRKHAAEGEVVVKISRNGQEKVVVVKTK